MRRDTLRVPGPGGAPSARRQAGAVRRRRAERADQGLGGRGRALGAALPRRLRGRPAQPGRPDPVRAAQRAARRAGRALLRRLARPRGADARARRARVHRRRAPPDRGVRRARRQLLHRAGLHQPAHHAGPGGCTAARRPAHRGAPDRRRGRARRVQPGADRDVRRRGGASATARRSSARSPTSCASGRPRAVPAGAASCCCGWRASRAATSRRSTPWPTATTAHSRRSPRSTSAFPAASPSAPPWTSTPGPTRRPRWCRSPRPCTSAPASRSSAAARAAAGSARPG